MKLMHKNILGIHLSICLLFCLFRNIAQFPISSLMRHIDLVAACCKSPPSKHAAEQWISSCKVQDAYNQPTVFPLGTKSAALEQNYLAQHPMSKHFNMHTETNVRNLKHKDVPSVTHLITDGPEFVTQAAEFLYVSIRRQMMFRISVSAVGEMCLILLFFIRCLVI